MANDADIQEIKQSIANINNKIEKVLKIESRLTKVEKYINLLDEDIKIISRFINDIQQNLEPVLNAVNDLGTAIVKGFNKIFGILQ